MTKTNSNDISRLRSSLAIESQKLLDTSTRLKRLQDDFLQKQITDKQTYAKKDEINEIRDESVMLRDYLTQTHMVNESNLKENESDLRRLE